MKCLKHSVFVYLLILIHTGKTFNLIAVNKQILYDYIGSVSVGAKAPQDADRNSAPPQSGWKIKGKLTLQMQKENTLAAALAIDEVLLDNTFGEKFQHNKEMHPTYKPFKIVTTDSGTISHIVFKDSDPIWSTNFKRAIASTLQIQVNSIGAFLVEENGIHGKCSTEYYVANKTNYLSIRKTAELNTCKPYSEAIHLTRSNVPPNLCEFDFQKNVIAGNEAAYKLSPHPQTEYFISNAQVKGITLVSTFESTGEAQFINSELNLIFMNETDITNSIDIETSMSSVQSSLNLLPLELNDPTGGRHPQQQENLITTASELLNSLAKGLESSELKFEEPYDSTVSDIIKILTQMNYESFQKLYTEVDIGTSYRQETIRNIFYEILPRIGTKPSVLLTRDLVMTKQIKPTTAVQLLISFPFHIYELSADLVRECEVFLTLGPDRPDVRQAAVLSFATLIHNIFVAGKLSKDVFEEIVQKYFNSYLNGFDYEQKMLYLQGLSNLQLGNVVQYLDPIIKDENENADIKFLAAWTTMPLAYTRPDKVYELYWPIFESKNSTLELRVAALTLLLVSRPTAARLLSIHRIIQDETCPHLINYYRTTVKSISETTYPCYQHLRRLLSYMHRHLPSQPENRYWVTGNYIFDYRDSKFGIGAMLQAFLVGDSKSDLPVVAYFKFDTEALGKFTGQLALYVKARGLPDAVVNRILNMNGESLKLEVLADLFKQMKMPQIDYTPLHLEFIVQMEGKTVLSYYLNQKTFLNLNYGDLISRLNFLIRADSHINMQTVRWPFMAKYAVPTVLGTKADVLLQTTVLTSLRGNITQHPAADAITRTHQIDVRYSSYASCKSQSYNPFLNLQHEINREQGLLLYFPIDNELNANITEKCLRFSFTRPENLISGMAFKSRSTTSTTGFITKTSTAPYSQIVMPERKRQMFQIFQFDTDDFGMSLSVNTNLHELNNYRVMLLKSEFMENGFSKSMIINALMYLFGVAQLSSIHIGNDRNFTLLANNKNFTRIEGSLCTTAINVPGDETGHKISLNLTHISDSNDPQPLHKWIVILNFLSSKSNWIKVKGIVIRSSIDSSDWKGCMNFMYSSMAFTKKPHTLKGSLMFGKSSGKKGCSDDSSKIEISASAGPQKVTTELIPSNQSDKNICPVEILKFVPVITSKICKSNEFANYTAISDYNAELKFNNMPKWFDFYANRLDHLISAFSMEKETQLNLRKLINVSVQIPNDQLWLSVYVNDMNWRMYHIPFLQKFDNKYETPVSFAYDVGLKRSCSLIRDTIESFDDAIIDISPYLKNNNSTCSTLLVGDCSIQPKMAIFLTSSTNQVEKFGLKVYVGGNYFTFEPQEQYTNEQEPIYITVNNKEKVNIRSQSYQFPILEKFYDFRIEISEQNILIVENTIMKSKIQFDMNNIIHIEIFNVYKNKMCGLCSQPFNQLERYNFCM